MAWNLFGNKDKEEDPNKEIEERMNLALQKARQDKRNMEAEIRKLDNWARDAIVDTYADFFPNAKYSYYKEKHKTTALEEYENMKKQYAEKLDAEVVEQCDRIVQGYLNQIELSKSKMQLYDKIVEQYENLKQKMQQAKQLGTRRAELSEHEKRLKSMDEDTGHFANSYMQSSDLEYIKNEVETHEEYMKQLDKISLEMSDKDNYSGALAYKDEVDKMLKNLNK